MIKVDNLTYCFNQNIVLDNVNLQIKSGDYLAIIGSNGVGKSTLLKCLIGINKVEKNKIYYENEDIRSIKKFDQIGYVPQINYKRSEVPISALEYLKIYSSNKEQIKRITEQLNLNPILNKNINSLSGGQYQKLLIAKSLLRNIKYLYLDEPITGLDFESRQNLYNLLSQLNKNGITIIIVSHHIDELSCKVKRIYDMDKKEIKEMRENECQYC